MASKATLWKMWVPEHTLDECSGIYPATRPQHFVLPYELSEEDARERLGTGLLYRKKKEIMVTERIYSFQLKEDGSQPLCGYDLDTGDHWSWYGNHEQDCPEVENEK